MKSDAERDRAIETLLRGRSERAAGDACLDAEILAAWVEGGLTGPEQARTEAHVADCSRCQALAAVMAQVPPDQPALEPWWRRSWGLGLLVPLTAGAAAVALWIAAPSPRQPPAPASVAVQNEAADAPKPTPQALTDRFQAPAVPGDALRMPASRAPQESAAAAQAAEKSAAAPSANLDRRDEREARQKSIAAAVASPPPPAATPAAAATTDAAASRMLSLARPASLATDIASPNPSIRWRLGPAGSIQYSNNGGGSWESSTTGTTVDLLAGASPAESVCWVVGRAGTVLLTTDGRRWQRVAFPEPVDLTSVQAVDIRTATVTASDGRTFRTADGGATWTPLQDF